MQRVTTYAKEKYERGNYFFLFFKKKKEIKATRYPET